MADDNVVSSLESVENNIDGSAGSGGPRSMSLRTWRRSWRARVVNNVEQLMLLMPLLLGVVGLAFDFANLLDFFVLSQSKAQPDFFWVFWAACLAFSFATVLLVFFIFLAIHVHESVDMENWFHARGRQAKVLICAVAFHYPACEILISNAFDLEIFNCPLSVLAIRRMRALGALAVLLDNVPKLVALVCIKADTGSLTWMGFGSLALAVLDIIGTLAASGMFWILTSEIERSRLRQRQLGRYRDGHKLFKLMAIPFAIGVGGLVAQMYSIRSFAMPVTSTTTSTTLGVSPTTLGPSALPTVPPPGPTLRPSSCWKSYLGNDSRRRFHHSPQDQDTVDYLNGHYTSYEKDHKIASGKLGVYIKWTTGLAEINRCGGLDTCRDGKANCILSTRLYNHRIELKGNSTCSQITTDDSLPSGFVIDSEKAESRYIRCGYIFDAGAEKRLNRGCGDAADPQTRGQECTSRTSSFFNLCSGKTCTDADPEVRDRANCETMQRRFPTFTFETPCFYKDIRTLVKKRIQNQALTPGDNTAWADSCKTGQFSKGNCKNRFATQNEVVMDSTVIREELGAEDNPIRAFVYKPGRCAEAKALRQSFSHFGTHMATIPLVRMNTGADVVTEQLFELDASCEPPAIVEI